MQCLYLWCNFSWIFDFLSKFRWNFIRQIQKFLLCLTHLSLNLKFNSITRHLRRRWRYHISWTWNLRSLLRVSRRKIWACWSNSIKPWSVLIWRSHVQWACDWAVKLKISSRVKVWISFHWSIWWVIWSARQWRIGSI